GRRTASAAPRASRLPRRRRPPRPAGRSPGPVGEVPLEVEPDHGARDGGGGAGAEGPVEPSPRAPVAGPRLGPVGGGPDREDVHERQERGQPDERREQSEGDEASDGGAEEDGAQALVVVAQHARAGGVLEDVRV
ncbi:hypothetical protein THAOC_00174, partial [Thalassiosira oceanica]